MNDLISRKALIAEYDRVHVGPPGGARKLMEDAPAVDAVEVIRCKYCLHKRKYHIKPPLCYCCYHGDRRMEDDFCSSGERRATNEAD